jgi:hypothetical protein
MSYYVGKNLDMRVRAFGLEPIRDYLVNVSAGKEDWVDGVKIVPKTPEEMEQLRITLYSLLHETGLKQMIQVRMTFGELTMWRKKEPKKAGYHIPRTSQPESAGDVLSEDMTNLFDESDPLISATK